MKQYICGKSNPDLEACQDCDHGIPHQSKPMYQMRHGIEIEYSCDERQGWCSVVRNFTLCELVENKSEIPTL